MSARPTALPNVDTIGEPGDEPEGYVINGHLSFDDAKAAIFRWDGFEISPLHALEHLNCSLECWECGMQHRTASGHLKSCSYNNDDAEGWRWNFKGGRKSTVVMRDGRSVREHYPASMP